MHLHDTKVTFCNLIIKEMYLWKPWKLLVGSWHSEQISTQFEYHCPSRKTEWDKR